MKLGLSEILAAARDETFWRARVPSLAIGTPRVVDWNVRDSARDERNRLLVEGYARIEGAVPLAAVHALATGIRSLHDANIPTPFIFVFDAAWELARGLAPTFDVLLGAKAHVMRDVWAWLVPAREGARGWSAHRGVTYDVRDASGSPTLVNVWIALSDVREASACMHVVPLPKDSDFPRALDQKRATANAISLPIAAGGLLAWNANALHWGGAMSADASPRLSISFSLRAASAADTIESPPTFEERIDVIADMLVTYADVDRLEGAWLEWARLWCGMRRARA